MNKVIKRDIVIEQGANFLWVFTLEDALEQPITTLSSARMQGRARKGASATLFDWSSAGGQITVDAAAGSVTVNVPAATTAALNHKNGPIGVYDIEVVETDGTVHRIFEGVVTFNREVTR